MFTAGKKEVTALKFLKWKLLWLKIQENINMQIFSISILT